MKFYDLDVQSNLSTGSSSPLELAKFAEELGFSGIAIADYWSSSEKLELYLKEIAEVQKQVGIKTLPAVKIRATNPNELKHALEKVRDKVIVVVVAGGNYQINRAACEDSRVDILAHPELDRNDNGLDEPSLNAAFANDVAIGMNFHGLLYSYRRQRSIMLNNIATNLRLCESLHVKSIAVSGAQSVWDMRDPRELVSIANVLGIDLGKSFLTASENASHIVEKNKKKFAGKIVVEGVERA